jgi:SSS family solute:Na+ symporter
MIVISLLLAWGLPLFYKESLAIIARGTAIFFGLCAASFLPMYVTGLYSKNATKLGAYSGLIVGFVVSLFWILFMHMAESKPFMLCQALFGKPSLVAGSKWAFVDPIVIALPLAFIVTWIGNKFGKKIPEKHVTEAFDGIK